MTYANLLDNEGINSQYLLVMKPRRVISGSWTNTSGTIYKISFTLGEVIATLDDGTALTEAASASVSSNEFYYDSENQELYVDVGADPASSQMIVTYELYFGTFDAHINRVPTDSSTRTVYFEPLIVRSPTIKSSTSDLLFGFLPTFSGSVTISNATNYLQEHLYESSFSNAEFDLYHWLGDLENANIKKVLTGLCNEVTYSDQNVTFNTLDNSEVFNKEYRNPTGPSYFTSATFSELDPAFENRPIRQVFGFVDGFRPVNIDYLQDSPTTSDNRKWICFADETNVGTVTTTVLASPSSTTTRTYLTSADGFQVGDQFRNENNAETLIITAVNKTGDHYIEHNAGTTASSGDDITRPFIANVFLQREGVIYQAVYVRDYTLIEDATNKVAGFEFTTAMESNNGGGQLQTNDVVWCRVYGHTNQNTLSASSFGSDSATTGTLANPVVILYQLLKELGITESQMNTTSFSSLESSVSEEVGFAIPAMSTGDFPTYKKLIIDLCQSILMKIFIDDDIKWKIALTAPVGASDKSVSDDEILDGTFKYRFSYKDIISLAIVEYAFREISAEGVAGGIYKAIQSSSTLAQNLHGIERQKTFKSLNYSSTDATTLADHIKYALGDRRGIATIRTKNRFFDTILDQVIEVSREQLPGNAYISGTERTRDFAAVKTAKSLKEITIDIDDQKGIEDNSGSW